MIGFELFFATIGSDLKSKNDVLVSVVHLQCIQRDFLCVGIGENFPESTESEPTSELLPQEWNRNQETYVLRYFNKRLNQKLLLKCVKVSDSLIISALLITGQNNGSTVSLRADDYITNNFNTFNEAFTSGSVDSVSQIIEKEVINKVLIKSTQTTTKTNESQTERTPDDRHPLRTGPPNPYYGEPAQGMGADPFYGQQQWPPPIGGADLDPLGRGQGGMFMDPRAFPSPFGRPHNPAPGLPRGAIPPGARFDPFGPPGVGPNGRPNRARYPGPDPDHMRPPGYDDMFM